MSKVQTSDGSVDNEMKRPTSSLAPWSPLPQAATAKIPEIGNCGIVRNRASLPEYQSKMIK
ncbi:hypothetical protein E2C01_010165 [Portunus trituberculatus]|uniref:Uncharacterized protein n=1 Tax=Portunus trituberculatus TaxID=210409 RepID=A0A5B7D7S3_PORTR|nr:hypothetical protein [Portunus trituberculatus]